MTPSVKPQIVAAPEPVLAIVWNISEEPRRHRHHVWLVLQDTHVVVIAVGIHVCWSIRPSLPGEESVRDTVASGSSVACSDRSPVRHEEAARLTLDVVPIVRLVGTLERCRDGFPVVLHVCRTGLVLVHVADDSVLSPCAVASIVEAVMRGQQCRMTAYD